MDFTNQCHLLIYFHNNKKRSFNWKIIFNNRSSLEKSEKINFQYTPFFSFQTTWICASSPRTSQDHLDKTICLPTYKTSEKSLELMKRNCLKQRQSAMLSPSIGFKCRPLLNKISHTASPPVSSPDLFSPLVIRKPASIRQRYNPYYRDSKFNIIQNKGYDYLRIYYGEAPCAICKRHFCFCTLNV